METVFASLVSDGNLDFTNIPARPNPSLTITDDDAEPGGAISGYKIKSPSARRVRTKSTLVATY